MTDAAGPVPGWYPDPYGSGAVRWWDGVRWTDQLAAPPPPPVQVYGPPARRPIPPETAVYTVWIWLVAVLPILPSLLMFLLHPQPLFREQAGSTTLHITDPLALLGGPLYFVLLGVSWLVTGAMVVFSWLDYRELGRRGVERPFHWAWSFLGVVYPIGRSVVVRGVARGRGLAPMWVAIAAYAVVLLLASIWTIMLFAQILGTATLNVPTGA